MRILLLGGTSEARALAVALASHPDKFSVLMSLSVNASSHDSVEWPCEIRVGGFGGPKGLTNFLLDHSIDAVVDATHPFATQMSANARVATSAVRVPLVSICREEWHKVDGDQWIVVNKMQSAADYLRDIDPQKIFLTIGIKSLALFKTILKHKYLIRTINNPAADTCPPTHRLLLRKGPFSMAEELALMQSEHISLLVTKNSGGQSSYSKIAAARVLGVPVLMVARPHEEYVNYLSNCASCSCADSAFAHLMSCVAVGEHK